MEPAVTRSGNGRKGKGKYEEQQTDDKNQHLKDKLEEMEAENKRLKDNNFIIMSALNHLQTVVNTFSDSPSLPKNKTLSAGSPKSNTPVQIDEPRGNMGTPASPVSKKRKRLSYQSPVQIDEPRGNSGTPASPVSKKSRSLSYQSPVQIDEPRGNGGTPASPVSKKRGRISYQSAVQIDEPRGNSGTPASPVSKKKQRISHQSPASHRRDILYDESSTSDS